MNSVKLHATSGDGNFFADTEFIERFFENLGDKVIYDDFDINVALVANAQ